MRLVPVTGTLEAVAKLSESSPRGAHALVTIGLFEALSDQVEARRPELEAVMLANMEQVAKKARANLADKNAQDALAELELVEEYVAKSLSGWLRDQFNSQHPRDSSGRWIRADIATTDANEVGASTKQSSSRTMAVSQATRWRNAGLIDDDTPLAVHHSRMDATGRVGTEHGGALHTTLREMKGRYDKEGNEVEPSSIREHHKANPDLVVTGLALDRANLPANTQAQRAALDVMTSVVGRDDATARRLLRGLPWDEQGAVKPQDTTAANWYAPSGTGGRGATDRQVYRRMGMTGTALARISAPGSTVNTVGGLAQLMGDLGPEAEKVLGPGIRRTAYRYRGTERRPDKDLVTDIDHVSDYADQMEEGKAPPALEAKGEQPIDVNLANYYAGAPDRSHDEKALGMRGDAAVAYMLGVGRGPNASKLASRELTELSLESGEVPPSEGIMIDANGQVASQAIGYNGDHYLPFDLRNLNGLFGGQYVRTRANGGPSKEDIYTGLVTGARQLQVVSNSGVFTLEFDPDLRGARRFNDKVKRMVGRYEEMLEAIAGGTLYQHDLSPTQMSALRRQAADASTGEKDYQDNLNTLVSRERMKQSLSDADADELAEAEDNYGRAKVTSEIRGARANRTELSDQAKQDAYNEGVREFRAKNAPGVTKLKLDGPGYDRAMRALQQEFPYAIRRAEYVPLPDWLKARGMPNEQGHKRFAPSDSGRVRAGQTNVALPASSKSEQARAKANRRFVPTGGQAPAPAAETTAAGAAPAAAAAGTAAAGVGTTAPVNLEAELKKPGGAYSRAVQEAAGEGLGVLANIEPPGMLPPEPQNEAEWRKMSNAHFTWEKLRNFLGQDPRAGAAKFADWLVGAEDWEQQKVLMSRNEVAGWAEGAHAEDLGFDQQRIDDGYTALEDLIGLQRPFRSDVKGEELPDDPGMLRVDRNDPRPAAFADISVSEPPNEGKLFIQEPHLQEHYENLGELDDAERVNEVNRLADAARYEQEPTAKAAKVRAAKAAHRAWAVLKAQETAEKLKKLGIGGGAGPKAPEAPEPLNKSDSRPRRQLLFHSLSGSSVVKSRRPPGASALALSPSGSRPASS